MQRLASMMEQSHREREESRAPKGDPTPERPAQVELKRSGDGIFKYIPEELRCEIRSVPGGIRLPYLPPIPPKLSPPVAPARIPVGIYRDGVAPQSFKNNNNKNTIRNRAGRLVFLSSKTYDEWQIPCLSGEFGETAADNEVLFHHNYDTVAKRRDAHDLILSEQGNANQEQAASHVATVEKYIRNRRFWEIETVNSLFSEQRPALIFPAPDNKVIELLLEWAPTNDPVLGYGVHKPIPTYDLAEFEALSVAEMEVTETCSAPLTRSQRAKLFGPQRWRRAIS